VPPPRPGPDPLFWGAVGRQVQPLG
jgi:hypothetical protein